MPSLTGLGILSFPFPGTAVPGYRLFRPYGTGPSDGAKVPLLASQVRPSDSLAHEPGWTSCHSTVGLWQYKRRVVDKIASTGKVGRPAVRFPGLVTTYPPKNAAIVMLSLYRLKSKRRFEAVLISGVV